MEKIKFSCFLQNNSDHKDLQIEIWLDNEQFFCDFIDAGTTAVTFDFEEDSHEKKLQIKLKNKSNIHTVIDDKGKILSDTIISVSNICFNGVDITKLINEKSTYQHDFNGNGQATCGKFYGDLGCNGTVELVFNTPLYIWLLENM